MTLLAAFAFAAGFALALWCKRPTVVAAPAADDHTTVAGERERI